MGNEPSGPPDSSSQGTDALLRAGVAAVRAGQRERARALLIRVLKRNPHNASAWLWLSGAVDRPDQQRDCLMRVLALDPDNQAARRGLAILQDRPREQPAPAVAKPAPIKPQRLQVSRPDAPIRGRRVSNRAVALGVSAGAVLLVVGLLLIRPSSAERVASQASPTSPPAEAAASPAATATPILPSGETPLTHSSPAEHDQAASTAATPTGRSASPSYVPVVLPTATPVPVVYPPTRLVIPSIGVDAPVVLADSQITDTGGIVQQVWTVPEASSAGWHEGSATLGVIGNTVINGHNWPQDAVFRDLHLVQTGEPITLYSNDTPFFYEVAEVLVIHDAGQPWEVQQANARYIQATDDERVTIFTCYPYGSIQNRFIVIARPAKAALAAKDE